MVEGERRQVLSMMKKERIVIEFKGGDFIKREGEKGDVKRKKNKMIHL